MPKGTRECRMCVCLSVCVCAYMYIHICIYVYICIYFQNPCNMVHAYCDLLSIQENSRLREREQHLLLPATQNKFCMMFSGEAARLLAHKP